MRPWSSQIKRRGLADPLPVVTDGAAGLIRAAETCFPRAVRQRCLVHRLRNLRSLLERLFLEARRLTKVVPHAFGEQPILKLLYAAVIRATDRWRGLVIGEFEQRQLRTIRDELNQAHTARVAPAVSAPTAVRKLRKCSRTAMTHRARAHRAS